METYDGRVTDESPPPKPWPVRAARWATASSGLIIVLLVLGVLVLPQAVRSEVRAVPDDLCALVPAELLARLVPAPATPERRTGPASDQRARAECEVSTEKRDATYGSLVLEVERHGAAMFRGAAGDTRDSYAGLKQTRLTGGLVPQRVADVPGLGDDAYVTGDASTTDRASRGFAIVTVLAGDTILTVSYNAAPSTDALATSAAVTVARAMLGGLR